jgi:hypothetical protein
MNTPNLKKRFALVSLAAIAFVSTAAHAELVQLDPVDFGGTGLGAVNTILTIRSPGSTSTEFGSVSWNGSADVISGNQVLTGASQTQTRSFADMGVASVDALLIVFNASEPGNQANGITLTGLTFSAYAPSGALVFSSSLLAPISYANTFTGAGNSGFAFGLSAADTVSFASNVASAGLSFATLRAGLAASAIDATGGNETFYIASSSAPVTAVPEPQTVALLLAGLGLVGFVARRRKA